MNVMVSTVGTSMLTNILSPTDQAYLRDNASALMGDATMIMILQRAVAFLKSNPEIIMKSAEIATLSLYAQRVASVEFVVPDTHYVFIATNTAQGRCCAHVIREFLQYRYGLTVQIYEIQGLQVHNSSSLDDAFLEFAQFLDELRQRFAIARANQGWWGRLNSLPNARMILNITGGFKIVSAWVQSYATLHGLTTIYKYESGDTLIVMTTTAPATPAKIAFYV